MSNLLGLAKNQLQPGSDAPALMLVVVDKAAFIVLGFRHQLVLGNCVSTTSSGLGSEAVAPGRDALMQIIQAIWNLLHTTTISTVQVSRLLLRAPRTD